MYLIVGLGNPEPEYSKTRHNMGFDVINKLSAKYEIEVKKEKFNGLFGTGVIEGEKVILLKPQTFMNASGECVEKFAKFYKIEAKDIITIFDDIDIETGTMKIRKKGGAGTHNGMKSMVRELNTTDFPRVRVGTGKQEKIADLVDYVIGRVNDEEYKKLEIGVEKAEVAVEEILKIGIDNAINKNEDGSNLIALVENGKLIEKYDDDESIKANEGNIYCGIVRDLLPGMQSAFIDIGEDKNAFIHIKDVIPKVSNVTGNKDENLEKYKIKDYLKVNMPVLVQVKKSEENLKGARVSTHISITGRLSVLMINVDFITISQKIENKEERARLKKLASEILSELNENSKYGLILRTSAEGKEKAEIEKDVADLIEIWKKIKASYNENLKDKRPQLIFQNYDVISKFLVSVLETDVDRVIVNSKNTCETILEYLKKIGKENVEVVLNKNEDLTQMHDIAGQIEEMKERKIWLKCGGFITIDKTEALTAIDINSGKFTGKKNSSKENTIYKVNQEATVEIAKQLRLRNISGIIVIDYIDMEEEQDRKNIMNLLDKELKKDRSKTQIMGFTKLDLLEMTRKKL